MKARMPSEKKRSGRRLRKAAFSAFTMAISVVAVLLAAEAAMALLTHRGVSLFHDGRYLPDFHARVFSPESRRVVDMRINRFGFRGPDWSETKPIDVTRIAFVGDSFVAAVAVEESETFVELAAKGLESEIGSPCEPMNFGVSGRDLADYLIHYRLFVRKFNPDLVVLCFYYGNDLRGRHPQLADASSAIDYRLMRSPDTPGLNGWLLAHSRLYNWYTAATRSARDNLRDWAVRKSPESYYRTMRERFERRWEDYRIYLDPPDEPAEQCWQTIEKQLAAFARDVAADGARLLVLGMPAEEQVSDSDWQRLCQEGGKEDGRGWSRFAPDRRLSTIVDRHNIEYLPLMGALSSRSEECYYGRGHLTPTGHRIVADAIVRRLATGSRPLANRSR